MPLKAEKERRVQLLVSCSCLCESCSHNGIRVMVEWKEEEERKKRENIVKQETATSIAIERFA